MVYTAVTHIQLVHHVNHAHNYLWVVGSIAVNLYVEDVSTTSQVVVRCLNLGLVACTTFIIYGHVVRVGIVIAIGYAGHDTKLLTVLLGKLSAQAFGWCGQYRVVVVVALAELVSTVAHVSNNLHTQRLCLFALAVMLANQGYQALSQSDKADTQCTLVNHALNAVHRLQLVGTNPQALHQQGELLGKGCLLELEAVVQLLGSNLQHLIQLGKEHVDTLLLVLLLAALQGQLYDVDGREAQVTTTDTGLRSESVLEHTCAASHRSHLVHKALRIVGTPLAVLVKAGIQIQEVREESAGCNLTCQLIQIEVTILGQVVHAALLFPDLNGEDGCFAVTHTLVGAQQYLAHHATALGTGVGTVVDTREHHLVTTTRVDCVHIVDKCLHGLMYTGHRFVDGMLTGTISTLQAIQRGLEIVHQRLVVQVL